MIITKGCQQEYGVNFDEFFSLVIKMTTLRFILRVVATKDMELLQLEVKMVHHDMDEEIYVEEP